MSDATPPFAFSQFVPGFDFLKNLADAAAGNASSPGAMPGMPGLSNWVAPTVSVEEVDKRIQELRTVQYWLEQNGHALKATIQALEVQKMTLSTLRGMNVRMEDLASAFTRHATPPAASAAPAAAPAPATAFSPFTFASAPAPQPQRESDADAATSSGDARAADSPAAGVVDPMQWWNALTSQFQEIATSAMHDAAQIRMPGMPAVPKAPSRRARSAGGTQGGSDASRKKSASPARGEVASTAKVTPPRKRARRT